MPERKKMAKLLLQWTKHNANSGGGVGKMQQLRPDACTDSAALSKQIKIHNNQRDVLRDCCGDEVNI